MGLQVVGAGLPRTGTSSLKRALEALLDSKCLHMTEIPGHPFDLGTGWQQALRGDPPHWPDLLQEYGAAVDWPASFFWRGLSEAYPDAVVLLSLRESPEEWWRSIDATILPVARRALASDHQGGRDLFTLFEQFTGTNEWDDPHVLMEAYRRHSAEVRAVIPPDRLLEWRAPDGWAPICKALDLPVPDEPFPWLNRRSEWR